MCFSCRQLPQCISNELQAHLRVDKKEAGFFKHDRTQGGKQWAKYYETGQLDANYFKLPSMQKQKPAASQPTSPTVPKSVAPRVIVFEGLPAAQRDADAVQDPELTALGLASSGSLPEQRESAPTWEDYAQQLQGQNTEDTATSPAVPVCCQKTLVVL